MATGILVNDFRPVYSENLLTDFNDGVISIVDGFANGFAAYDSSVQYDTGKSIKATINVVGLGKYIHFDVAGFQKTVTKTGNYLFQFSFRKGSALDDVDVSVEVFINGISYPSTFVFYHFGSDIDETNNTNWHTVGQNIALTASDIVTFRIGYDSTLMTSSGYFDAFKLEYDDRNLGTPSIYSKPLVGYIEKGATGWESKTDTTNIISLTAATDNVMTLSATSDSNGGLTLLDSNSKIIPIQLNDVLSIEFACTFITPAGTERSIDVYLRVGVSFYRGYNYKLTKGASNNDFFSVNWNLPCGVDVMANDVEIVLNPTSTMDYKDRYINVARIHKAI